MGHIKGYALDAPALRPSRRSDCATVFSAPVLPQREVNHAVGDVGRVRRFCDEFQVGDALSHGDAQLMCVNNARERYAFALPPGGLGKEVFILAEDQPPERGRPVQECSVVEAMGPVVLGRPNVHAPGAQAARDLRPDVDVHVKADTHPASSEP